MAAIENEKIYGLKIRESADDGSDFSNPDADYRMLFLGEDGALHLMDSAGTVTDVASPVTLASAKGTAPATTYATPATGTSFTDVDATEGTMLHTITTGARRVMVGFTGGLSELTDNDTQIFLDVMVDGVSVSSGAGVTHVRHGNFGGDNASFTFLTDVLTAGAHVIKLQWRTATTTRRMNNVTAFSFWVQEMG